MRHAAYARTQWLGPLWVIVPAIDLAVMLLLLEKTGAVGAVPMGIVLVLTLPVLLLLGCFSVEVGEGRLEWHFGFVGWPRWQLPLGHITSATATRTTWRDGWGIQATKSGMLYNATGYGAVRLHLRSGHSLRLGSDEPERLAAFISARLQPSVPAFPPRR